MLHRVEVVTLDVLQDAAAAIRIGADLTQTLLENLDASPLPDPQSMAIEASEVRVETVQQLTGPRFKGRVTKVVLRLEEKAIADLIGWGFSLGKQRD